MFVPLHLISQNGTPSQACRPKESKPYLFGMPNRDRNELVSSSRYPNGTDALRVEHGGADSCVKSEEDCLRPQGLTHKPSENASSLFQMEQRVVFQDKHGAKHCGVIRWTSTGFSTMAFTHPVVGIQTVSSYMCILGSAYYPLNSLVIDSSS